MPYRALTICLLLALSGFSASYLLQHTNWYYHDLPAYSVATILGFLLWALSVQYGHFSSLPRMILFAVVSIIVLIYPVHTILRGYVFAKNYQRAINPLLAFLNNHAQHKTVYFFSTSMHYEFPAVDYSHSIPASRYPLLIWVSGYQRQLQEKMSEAKQKKLALDNDFFMQTLLSEIHANQPNYIFVETSEHKQYLTGIPYDYLQDFLRYSTFKKIWQDYRYLTTIDHSPQYRFAIYQRRDNA